MKLKDHLNLEANDELHTFLKATSNGKTTGRMKYDAFIKQMLTKMRPIMGDYMTAQEALIKACTTVEQIEKLKIPALPNDMRDQIIEMIDKQKHLDIVEKTYMALDAFRAISTNIGANIGKMCMTWAGFLQKQNQSRIIQPGNGKIIIP